MMDTWDSNQTRSKIPEKKKTLHKKGNASGNQKKGQKFGIHVRVKNPKEGLQHTQLGTRLR